MAETDHFYLVTAVPRVCFVGDLATDVAPLDRRSTALKLRWRTQLELGLAGLALAVVVWFYGWTVRTEGAFEPPGDNDYHAALVQGWRGGHLYMNVAPKPEMLRLADPYDPVQNGPYRLPDASYFRGHYYLYFGAAPALTVMLPYALVTGREMNTATAVFVFCVLALTGGTALWLALRRRYFPASGIWVAPAGVLVLGFGTHLLALARRPMWWELPIAASIAFCVLALCALYIALHTSVSRNRVAAFGAAGLSLGLAIASRPTAAFAVLMLLPPLWWTLREDGLSTTWRRSVIAAASGLLVCAAAVAAHNFARFGSPLEFGQKYQLSGMYEGKLRHFAFDYVWPNFWTYFLQAPHWRWEFPFVQLWTRGNDVPGYVDGEELCGLFATFPVLLVALAVPFAWWQRKPEPAQSLRPLIAAIVCTFAAVAVIIHLFFSATERYAAEFGFPLGMAALIGWLGLEARLGSGGVRRAVNGAIAVAVTACVVVGALVSFDYHGQLLSRDDPATWKQAERLSDAVLGRLGLALGQFTGSRVLKVRFRERAVGTTETFWQSTDDRAAEKVFVEYVSDREIRFGYRRGTGAVTWGHLLRWEPDHTHTVELQLPSLHGRPAGWMRNCRRALEFKERSSVALWFSGGRALEVIVPALDEPVTPGGNVGADFSGDVRAVSTRLYRDDEIGPSEVRASGEAGGTLRLRVQLADPLADEGEPLLTIGARYGSDIVFVRRGGNGVEIAFEHFGEPAVFSRALSLDHGREHVIDLRLPSCARGAFGREANGTVVVHVDGKEVLRRDGVCHGFWPGSETIGINQVGTTCASSFRGWILSAEWVE